jgi:Protein of unknown function (DUF3800)
MRYDLFVDESCHLEHDGSPAMVIGYVKVAESDYEGLFARLKAIKADHGVKNELKWSKFSAKRLPLYMALVDMLMDYPISFRCVLVKHKDHLRHDDFNQGSHENFYYKMVYYLLRVNTGGDRFRVFFDTKDTRGREKLKKIAEVLRHYNFGDAPFLHLQHLRSHENVFFELVDLLIGAVGYRVRVQAGNLRAHPAREAFMRYVESKIHRSLESGTPPYEQKFNVFEFSPTHLP